MADSIVTQKNSEYNQTSFKGGMNLIGDDSRLSPDEYRIGFNLTNRDDVLDPVFVSQKDIALPKGLKQEMITFGNFIVVFIAGFAYYRYYAAEGWQPIPGFKMSSSAPRLWTVAIPVATTNYLRLADTAIISTNNFSSVNTPISVLQVAGASGGNLPGLLVQDNISQPQFIFLDGNGLPTCRVTQSFAEWGITFTDATNTKVATDPTGVPLDNREYVPIGNVMTWQNGILFIVAQDFQSIYRSVSGRPLDFVVNVSNLLADNTTTPPYTQRGGGDATTTAYSVGVGGISCIRALSSGGIFVSASGANFAVTLNQTPGAPTIFGEYTFNRTFLFNAFCLSDRTIMDSLGDTRFISLTGIRSFNAIEQTQNEGRNEPFSKTIQAAFGSAINPIIQDATESAAILYDNYELYAVSTIFGPAIAKFDTINECWTSFDTLQTGGKAIKILAKIELTIQRLFAITEDDELYTLYIGPEESVASFRTAGVCANILYLNTNVRMAKPKNEVQLRETRVILNKVKEDTTCSFTPYVNNALTPDGTITKSLTYTAAPTPSVDPLALDDVNTNLFNLAYPTPEASQGWKVFAVFSWTGASFTQFSYDLMDVTPQNPLNSQETTQ